MYETHFGFSDLPFKLTPDPRFHVDTAPLRAALRALRAELDAGRPFLPLVAGSGLGKTTVARRLLREMAQARHHAGELQGLSVEGDAFYRRVAEALALPGFDAVHPLGSLMQSLEALAARGRKALLLVDEVQQLDVECLKRLRKLAGVESAGRAALHVCLVGRAPPPGLEDLARIGRPLDLGQQVGLAPLDAAGTRDYVLARLARAGWSGRPALDEEAVAEIHDRTGGNPSRVNRLCGHVLLQLYIQRRDDMSADVVRAVADLQEAEFEARSPPALDLPLRSVLRPIAPPRPPEPDPDAQAADFLATQLVVERDVDIELPLFPADPVARNAVPPAAGAAAALEAWPGPRRRLFAPGLALLGGLALGAGTWQAMSGRVAPGPAAALRYAAVPASATPAPSAAAPADFAALAQQTMARAPTAAGPASAAPPAASTPMVATLVARPRVAARPRAPIPVASTCGLEGETLGLCTRPADAAPARAPASSPGPRPGCDPVRAGMGLCSVR